MRKHIVVLCISLAAWFIVASLLGFYFAIRPLKINSIITPSNYQISYENIQFKTCDGLLLSGWYIPSKNKDAKTIILLHGYPADKGDILPSALFLHDKFNLLFFDFRYFGKSEGGYTSIGKIEINDLLAAIQYLKTKGINEVGVWGFSMGGAVAVMTAPHSKNIRAIVSESSYARLDWLAYDYYKIPGLKYVLGEMMRYWGKLIINYDIKEASPVLSAANISIPILMLHSKDDHVIPFFHAVALENALKHDKQLKVIYYQDRLHGQAYEDREEMIRTFFEQNL